MRILLGALLCSLVLPAYGSVIPVSGVSGAVAPPSVSTGQMLSDTTMYVFNEQIGVTLASALNVGIVSPGSWFCCSGFPGGTIAAGTTVDSYLLRAAPVTDDPSLGYRDFTGTISFSPGETIVGIILGYANVAGTDALLGAPGTIYPAASLQLGGLENGDTVVLGNNLQSIYVNFHVDAGAGGMDMIRIMTTTPEPADFVLIGSGLAVLGLLRRGKLFSGSWRR